MNNQTTKKGNPSRATCEGIIKRILITNVLEHGSNTHFKTAADFMNYFESLYPASDALTKQVQRAIKALDMPKDENGYFIVNKTVGQFEQEQKLSDVFHEANISVDEMEDTTAVFLNAAPHLHSYIMHLIQTTDSFNGKYITMVETFNGILIYTNCRNQLVTLLNSLTT